MDVLPTAESQLLADIEHLRVRHPNTQELYGEVCAIMFFRYGMTPTANRLYQLVRKGSMSAPAEALNRFWSRLRERSRVMVDGADLPDGLKASAGELLSTLWKQAREAAEASHAASRAEAEAAAAAAEERGARADARAGAAEEALQASRAALAAAHDDAAALRQELAAAQALNTRLQQRLEDARREMNEQHAWYKSVEREHAAAARHAARELEREQALSARLQRSWDDERVAAATAAERHHAELRDTVAALAGRLAGATGATGAPERPPGE